MILDELPWFDRILPWRRKRRLAEAEIDQQLTHMTETVNGFKKEHGLDQLAANIEQVRAQGEAAMEAAVDDRQERQEQRASRP
jgi:hypothetical protein